MQKIEAKIWMAIRARIETLLPTYKKAWPAEVFQAPASGVQLDPFLRIGRVSVDPVRVFIESGQRHDRTGSVIVTLVHPLRTGYQAQTYDAIACQIAEHFPDGLNMRYGDVCVEVTSAPYVNEGYEDNGYWTIPVSIPWRCFA